MEDKNSQETPVSSDSKNNSESDSFNLVGFDSDRPSQRVFKFLGYELIAPDGMKNPGLIYLLFIIINLAIFLYLRTRL